MRLSSALYSEMKKAAESQGMGLYEVSARRLSERCAIADALEQFLQWRFKIDYYRVITTKRCNQGDLGCKNS
jgi:hypothetical protein